MRRKEREITEIDEIEAIIGRCDVCRIALTDDNIPYIVTMNFGYSGGARKKLFFHSAGKGRKIDIIRTNNHVCFEMDTDHNLTIGREACDFSMKYSSVVGWGDIFIISDDEERMEGMNSIMKHYSNLTEFNYKQDVFDKTTILKLEIKTMTGKKT
ncbi:MAG TPA: pyridoxamine 5'-phosphate oxidase family protein [Bacteroidales bacterium]|nr:pyridoxamine 5'-phosphate oxidase family protein [Bacteroidales bacterium]HBZ19889.1 pyridoxamine 5'-phosphate oxidase family protein [Bacteroidales bacterium]